LNKNRSISLNKKSDGIAITFFAMASPCEVIVETSDKALAQKVGKLVANEVWRIEDKYSRYDKRSLCYQINNNDDRSISIDNETFLLLEFSNTCYLLSEGLFDITSGVLRKVWCFDGSDNVPSIEKVSEILPKIGWSHVNYSETSLTLPKGMEIDLGGIGKEYAVDRAILLIKEFTDLPVLVNLGGDLAATSARNNNQAWQVGIEHPGFEQSQPIVISLLSGALATSGDAKRYLLKDGIRYSHILNAKTGWPIVDAPRSITVNAPQCIQAGILATLALMQGQQAENFLNEQTIKFWAVR